MNRFTGLAVIVVLIAFLFSCADDIILEGMPSLEGEYKGIYMVITDDASSSADTIWNNVIWTFYEKSYVMDLDKDNHTGVCFCRVNGLYSFTEGIDIREDDWVVASEAGCTACDEGNNPNGVFVRESIADTLVLKLKEGTTLKMLKLVMVSGTEN